MLLVKFTQYLYVGSIVQRIYKYFDEINEIPVVYHWTWKLDDIDGNEEATFETLLNNVVI